MHWMVAHVYIVLLAIIALATITGGLVLTDEPTRSVPSVNTWRAGGFTFLGNEPAGQNSPVVSRPSTPQAVGVAGDYSTIEITGSFDSAAPTLPEEWQSLLKQLVEPSENTTSSEPSQQTGAYSFIPQGLISITDTTQKRTSEQEELYIYGNQVGSLIRAFDESHRNMITVLKDAYADRNNVAKREAAEIIGTDYESLGKALAAFSDVPVSVNTMHAAIAQSYQDAGKKMILKLRTQTDEEFLAAMHTYNASVLQFTNNFVALATYLSAQGVKFSTSDPGSVFTFTSF